jgi:hypothetical protein
MKKQKLWHSTLVCLFTLACMTTRLQAQSPLQVFVPTVASNHDGRLEVFARGSNRELWHIWQFCPNAYCGWSNWASFGNNIDAPLVQANADGRLEVFAGGSEGELLHIWEAPAGGWSGWFSLGDGPLFGSSSLTSIPAIAINADGRLEAFARLNDNALWHTSQVSPGGGCDPCPGGGYLPSGNYWYNWATLGGAVYSGPAVAVNADGRLEAFFIGFDRGLYHNWQVTPGGVWSGWFSLGGVVALSSSVVVGVNADGRLEVFVTGSDYALWHINQKQVNGSVWSGWTPLGAPIGGTLQGPPAVAVNADGRLEVFDVASDGALWHISQATPNGPGWSSWETLGDGQGIAYGWVTVGRNADGRLEAFVQGQDDALWHIWQGAAGGGGGWSSWNSLGK